MSAEEEVERHNLRCLWEDCAQRFEIAAHELEQAATLLEADLRKPHLADRLAPLAARVRQFQRMAESSRG